MISSASIKVKWSALKATLLLKFNSLTGYGMSFEDSKTESMLKELNTTLQKTIEELRKSIAAL
jgi:hypothetical protein